MSDPAIVSKLRELYPAPEHLVLAEVRSATGYREEVRYADAVALSLWPSSKDRLIGFEFKTAGNARHARADLRRELEQPQKSHAIGRFCSQWFLVVRAPWKKTLFSLSELPEGWGLIEIGTGKPEVIRRGEQREAEPLTEGLMLSLIRSASEQGTRDEAGELHARTMAAPLRAVTRPRATRDTMGLSCGHTVPRGLMKKTPAKVHCTSCAEGLPTDKSMLDAILREMGQAELAEVAELVEKRRAMPAWAVGE